MIIRVISFLVLLISILFAPFWVSVILALAGMIYFSFFWESAILFLLSDLLYGTSEARFLGITFISTIISVVILVAIELLKKKVRISK